MLYYIIDDTKSERYNCHTEIRTCRLHMAAAPCCDVEAYIPTYSYERALVSQSVGKSVSWRVSQSVSWSWTWTSILWWMHPMLHFSFEWRHYELWTDNSFLRLIAPWVMERLLISQFCCRHHHVPWQMRGWLSTEVGPWWSGFSLAMILLHALS